MRSSGSLRELRLGCCDEHNNLPESNRFRSSHPECGDLCEVSSDDAGAIAEPLERNDENQNAMLHQPAMRVFQEKPLDPPVAAQIDL